MPVSNSTLQTVRAILANGLHPRIVKGKIMMPIADSLICEVIEAAQRARNSAPPVSEAEVEAARRAANEFFATVELIEIRDGHFELPGDQTTKLFRFVLEAAQRARK